MAGSMCDCKASNHAAHMAGAAMGKNPVKAAGPNVHQGKAAKPTGPRRP